MRCIGIVSALLAVALTSALASGAEPTSTTPKAPISSEAMPAVTSPVPVAQGAAPTPAGATRPAATGSQPARRPGSDRLDLDTTVVTGNRELPKVLYIVPWKRAELGDLPQQPLDSLLDEVLTPVDRDVFRREVTYYGAISEKSGAAQGAPAGSATGSEK